jgi:IS1 family transposase
VQPQAVTVVALELEEAWSFVGKQEQTAWLYQRIHTCVPMRVALEPETSKIRAWMKGDRSKRTAKGSGETLALTRWQKRDAPDRTDFHAGYDSIIQ